MKTKSFYEQGLETDALLSQAIYSLTAATQTLKSLREEFANKLLSPPNEAKWDFPVDNYSVLATWLIYDPKAHILFPIHQRKSWAELADFFQLSTFNDPKHSTIDYQLSTIRCLHASPSRVHANPSIFGNYRCSIFTFHLSLFTFHLPLG